MRNTRMASRLMAILLTVLMLVSCFVALPAMAEGTTTDDRKTELWSYDFDSVGDIANSDIKSTSTKYPGGYLVNNNVFYCVSGTNYDASKTSGSTSIKSGAGSNAFRGLIVLGGNVLLTDQTTANGKRDFYDLMYGIYGKQVEGENRPTQSTELHTAGSTYFWEFDFAQSKATLNYDETGSYTVPGGSPVTLSTQHRIYLADATSTGASGGSFFSMMCGGGNQYALFRVTSDGYVYTRDNEATASDKTVSVANTYYTLDANGERVYLPVGTTLTGVTKFWYRTDKTKGYKIELDKQYRIGVLFKVNKINTNGEISMQATVYIKPEGQANWDTCVGTTEYYYRDTDYTGGGTVNEAGRAINMADNSSYLYFGGNTSIYTYVCDGTNHLNVLETPVASDATKITCKCIDCGETWGEREIDGVRYIGKLVAGDTPCDGDYYIWIPQVGVGLPFADSAFTNPPADHTYNTSGVCTGCGKVEVEGYMSPGFYASGSVNSKTNPTTYTTSEDGRGHIYKSNRELTYIFGDVANGAYKIGDKTKPFTISFDLNVNGVEWRSGKPIGDFAELVSLAGSDATKHLLQIGKNPDGTSFLSLAYDFAPGGVKTKEEVKIDLTTDGRLDTNDPEYAKFEKWFAVCAAPGQDPNTAVAGPITNDNGDIVQYNYFTTTEADNVRTYTFYYPQVGQYAITEDEWFHVAVTVVPDPSYDAHVLLYVNGELVAHRPQALSIKDWQSVRFGEGSGRFTKITNTRYDNFSFRVHESIDEAYMAGSNEMVSLDFDNYVFRPFDSGFTASTFGNDISNQLTRVGTFANSVDADAVIYQNATHGSYAHFNKPNVESSDALQFALSTKLGGSSGAIHNVVSNAGKYEINVRLAVDKASSICGENSDGSLDMVLLSRDRDDFVNVVLMGLTEEGYSASGHALYDKDGNRVGPYTTVTNNVPEKFSNVRVVVDEESNTYSIYVNENVVYYKDENDVLHPYCNVTIPIDTSKVADSYSYTCEILSLFQSWSDFYVQDISVSVIPDSEVEMIGVQEQRSENAFDLRFIAGVKDVFVTDITFEVEAYYNGVYKGIQSASLNNVFSTVKEGSSVFGAYDCPGVSYLAALKVTGMERTGASNRYEFKVTPITTLPDGTEVRGETYLAVYDGEGRYLGNGKPLSADLSQIEVPTTKPVMLELHAKSGEGDYEDFYVYTQCSDPSGRYYVRYKMAYSYDTRTTNGTNSATNLNSFRIIGAELVRINSVSDTAVSYIKLRDLLSSGEISLAIKEYKYDETIQDNSIQDFCGGFHGDEHIVEVEGVKQVALAADGVSYTPGDENKLIQCDVVTFDMTTTIDRWAAEAGTNGQIVTHEQSFTFTDDGMAIDRKVTWLVDDFVIDGAYPMMFTLLRLDGEDAICESVEAFDANDELLEKKVFPLNNTTGQSDHLKYANARRYDFSSETSGIFAEASFTLGDDNGGVLGTPWIAYRTDKGGADNKLYVPMKAKTNVTVDKKDGTTTKTQPKLGDVWEINTFYNIDYVRPTN